MPHAPLLLGREFLTSHGIDIVVHGDDIDPETLQAFYGVPDELGMMRLLPYTSAISTSDIIARIECRDREGAVGDDTDA